MSLRLHLVVEKRVGDTWESAQDWDWNGSRLYPSRPLYRDRPDTHINPLYAALGADLTDFYIPERGVAAAHKGLPEDMHTKTERYTSQFDSVAPHHAAVDAFLAFPWLEPLKRIYDVSPRAVKHWELTGVVPTWAHTEPEEIRTCQIYYSLGAVELWGREWVEHTINRLMAGHTENDRIIYFFTARNR